MRWATQHKVSGLYISQTLILSLWPDPDLARDLKIKLEAHHRKVLSKVILIGSVLSRAFVCRLARVAALLVFGFLTGSVYRPPPHEVAGGEIPQQLPG